MAGRGRGAAHVNSRHCAAYLIALLGAEQSINSPAAVEVCSELMPTSTRGDPIQLSDEARQAFGVNPERREISVDAHVLGKPFLLEDKSFLEGIATLIEWARIPQASDIIQRSLIQIRCCRNWPEASITCIGMNDHLIQQYYSQPPGNLAPGRVRLRPWQIGGFPRAYKIDVDASIRGGVLSQFADLIGPKDGPLMPLHKLTLEPW